MTTAIKAIETRYNGYRFRSRLEARWAVFFDTLGIKYEYEKEGYDLGKHGWYLPDFWLPDLQLWYEIKGEIDTAERVWSWGIRSYSPELERVKALADFTGWPAACAVGSIGEQWIQFYAWDVTDSSGGDYDEGDAQWCFSNGIYTLDVTPGRADRVFISDNLCGVEMPQFSYPHSHGGSVEPVIRGFVAARQARFEFGESGRT